MECYEYCVKEGNKTHKLWLSQSALIVGAREAHGGDAVPGHVALAYRHPAANVIRGVELRSKVVFLLCCSLS